MGSGSFSYDDYRSYSHSVKSKPVDHIYASRKLDPSLDPKGVKVRESRDSADSPEATPIIVDLDVTGSMGMIAEYFAKEGLGTLFQGIFDKRPVQYPHIMFAANGDVHAGDDAPLQVSQFEADNRIVDQLTKIWLVNGGGGNDYESYDLPWYFAARHTVHDAMEKRGKRGYLFTIGDEEAPHGLRKEHIETVFGYKPQSDFSAELLLREAQRLYDVFHVVILQGNHASQFPEPVKNSWLKLLGQRTIMLSEYKLLSETIVSAIQVAEGADAKTVASGWGGAAKKVIGDAISSLPRGVPAPKRLGL